jgi:hypothetical protein
VALDDALPDDAPDLGPTQCHLGRRARDSRLCDSPRNVHHDDSGALSDLLARFQTEEERNTKARA